MSRVVTIKRNKSHTNWSWIFMVIFIMLSIIDFRFGLLGMFCMGAPLYHAFRKKGKIHCSHYCPRGSLLGKFLKNLSMEQNMPSWAKSKFSKNILLIIMMIMFSFSLYHANQEGFNIMKTGFAIFRMMTVSLAVGIIIGIIFKPRSWCQVCPMGHATALIDKAMKK